MRRAITLLETLIAIFVLAIGMLGLAALIPIARNHQEQAGKVDRAATLGRAAMQDMEIRGLVDPANWLVYNTAGTPPDYQPLVVGGSLNASLPQFPRPPFVFDPLSMAHPANAPTTGTVQPTIPFASHNPYAAVAPPIYRVTTLPFVPTNPPTAIRYQLAQRAFMGHDDVVYDRPDNREERPSTGEWRQGADGEWGVAGVDDDGANGTDDDGEAGYAGSDDRLLNNAEGNYSWLATVSMRPQHTSPPSTAVALEPQYVVSLVTFYRRELQPPPVPPAPDAAADPPSERMVLCDIIGGGVGGGSVVLRIPVAAYGGHATDRWLEAQPNTWLMLSAWIPDSRFDPIDGAGMGRRTHVAWYRIVAVDEGIEPIAGGGFQRFATLAGTDWDAAAYADADTTTMAPTVYATLFTGAVDVRERTITPGT